MFSLIQAAIPAYAPTYSSAPTEISMYTPIIVPRMKHTARVATNLIIDSKEQVTITVSVDGYKNITSKVNISADLQRYKNGKWSKVTTFFDSDNSHRIEFVFMKPIECPKDTSIKL
ncbi:MAG: hypothetical protein ACOCM4_15575 [Acetivibrio ethanolgignens]